MSKVLAGAAGSAGWLLRFSLAAAKSDQSPPATRGCGPPLVGNSSFSAAVFLIRSIRTGGSAIAAISAA